MVKVTHPTVNMNGSGKEYLLSQYTAALLSVQYAIDIVAKSVPHGRDYQTQTPNGYKNAAEEHRTRMQRLNDIRIELETIAVELT